MKKKDLINFLETKWRRRILQTNPFFLDSLLGGTTNGRNFVRWTKNEKDSENVYKNEVNVVGFFQNLDFSKNGVKFNRKNCFRRVFFFKLKVLLTMVIFLLNLKVLLKMAFFLL